MKNFSTVQITSIFKSRCLAESTASYKERLYGSLLFHSIKSNKKSFKNTQLKQIAYIEYDNALWALFMVGVLDIYHSWEKNVNQFFKEENIPLKKKDKADSFIDTAKTLCNEALQFTIPDKTWNKLDELRQLVNTYKHGSTESFRRLKNKYPKYFKRPIKYILDSKVDYSLLFRITKAQFMDLSKNITFFWKIINKNL